MGIKRSYSSCVEWARRWFGRQQTRNKSVIEVDTLTTSNSYYITYTSILYHYIAKDLVAFLDHLTCFVGSNCISDVTFGNCIAM